ncbi:MAG TPA: UDP-N-acetylmuramate dehydrogenase [Flavobacteriaceae bacterium]|nr:UDP-N-acetylmuramate dehydrogenase [Flavobacteriaceae bacterium]
MQILENISLKPYNTFGIDVTAERFVKVNDTEGLLQILKQHKTDNKLILGGGSNLLLTQDIKALVIQLNLKGKTIVFEDDNIVYVKANAGENWHEFVLWCLERNYGGIENLSLIPGNIGTAPMQNIGAYGVELKDVFESCEAINLKDFQVKTFSNTDCKFGYRESVFKQEEKGNYIITSVTLKLSKDNHKLHTDYGAITTQLEEMGITNPSIQDVSNAVIAIRKSKLPDPAKIGNSGSFFKNPVVSKSHFESLKLQFPEIPSYPVSETEVKVPAGWLIEKAGFKGKTLGNYGVHKKQALVLVNYGGAKGNDIYKLALLIQKTIHQLFEIEIETEVNIL